MISFESSANDHVENVVDNSHIKNILSQYISEAQKSIKEAKQNMTDVVRGLVSTLETVPLSVFGEEFRSKDLNWSDLLRMNGHEVFDMIIGMFSYFKDPVAVLRYAMDIYSQEKVIWKVHYKFPPINKRGDSTKFKFNLNPHYNVEPSMLPKMNIVSCFHKYICFRCCVRLKAVAEDYHSTVFDVTYRDKNVIYPLSFLMEDGKLDREFEFSFRDVLEGELSLSCNQFLGAYRIEISWDMGYSAQSENCLFGNIEDFSLSKYQKKQISSTRNVFQTCSYKVLYYDMLEEKNFVIVRPKEAVRNISQQRSMYSDLFYQIQMHRVNEMCSVCYRSPLDKEGCVIGEKFIGAMQCNHPICFDCFRLIIKLDINKYFCPICRRSFWFPFGIHTDYLKRIQYDSMGSDSCEEEMDRVPEIPDWLKCPSCELRMERRGNALMCYLCCLQRLQIRCLMCGDYLYLIVGKQDNYGFRAGMKVCFHCQ